MDMYYPEEGDGPLPVAVFIHGGAWRSGNKSGGLGDCFFDTLLDRGYLLVSLNYRLSPKYKFPAHIEDVKCAIRHLRAEAGNYGLDPEHIGVLGGSSGGHLAALLGTSGGNESLEGHGEYLGYSSRVQAVVDISGPVNADFFCLPSVIQVVFDTTDCQSKIMTIANPLTYITSDDPPFLILHGRNDKTVPLTQSLRLYAGLASAGLPVELITIKYAGHALYAWGTWYEPDMKILQKKVGDFFDQYLKNLP